MSRACELTGKSVQYGNNVSHANNKTRRRFLPNLFHISLASESLQQEFRFKISAYALRSVEQFLLKSNSSELSPRARLLKKRLTKDNNKG